MKKIVYFLVMVVIFSVIACSTQAEEKKVDASKTGGLPLLQNWYWQYQLITENQDHSGEETATIKVGENETIEVKVKKTSTVTKTAINKVEENDRFILAELSKISEEATAQTIEYWLFEKASGKIWQGSDSLKENFLSNFSTPPENEVFLILPLKVKQGWLTYLESERDDHWYQWYVEDKEIVTVPAGTFNCFRLAYRCVPDHELIWFCPDVGIVKQEYIHHGSISNMFMELTAYGLAK